MSNPESAPIASNEQNEKWAKHRERPSKELLQEIRTFLDEFEKVHDPTEKDRLLKEANDRFAVILERMVDEGESLG